MTLVQTLDERKRARVEEIRAGLVALRKKLTEYGRAHGAKFMMFGSAVTGRLNYDSDVDILVDFDEVGVGAALDFVETTCAALKLHADVQPKAWCKEEFIARIAPGSLVIS
jgi:predicted nucleotidyltransferase